MLLRCCCDAVAMLLQCCCDAVAMRLRCGCDAVAMRLRCGCDAVAMLLWWVAILSQAFTQRREAKNVNGLLPFTTASQPAATASQPVATASQQYSKRYVRQVPGTRKGMCEATQRGPRYSGRTSARRPRGDLGTGYCLVAPQLDKKLEGKTVLTLGLDDSLPQVG